jgi:hypothetical protein
LRRFHRYEFLIDPVTKRARVAGVGYSPFLLVLLGLVYLGLAAAFYYLTSNSMPYHGGSLPVSPPGEWVHFQTPPWHQPTVASARSSVGSVLSWGLGAAILLFGVVMQWTSRTGTLLSRVGLGSIALFVAAVLSICALDRATYRIEADSVGLRESSALRWRMTPWPALRGAVEETVHHYMGGSWGGRSTLKLDYPTHRVYFTDDQGEEVVSINNELVPEQRKALLAHVLERTGLHPTKRELGKK